MDKQKLLKSELDEQKVILIKQNLADPFKSDSEE